MIKAKYKTIGILGGMGPEASAEAYKQIIQYAQEKYNAIQDNDYPPIIIYSLPLDGFDETGIVNQRLVKDQLIGGVKKLNLAGADFIFIACNTVHYFYDEMQQASKIPILNIIEEARKAIKQKGYKKAGLFASETTNKLNLYQNDLNNHEIEVITVNQIDQQKINKIIEHVMGGNQSEADTKTLNELGKKLINQGAECIIMGCTEIPLAINQTQADFELIDTTRIIVKSAVDYSITNSQLND